MPSSPISRVLCIFMAAAALVSCATTMPPVSPTFEEARALIAAGRIEEGLARVQDASREDPSNQEYRAFYFRQRESAVQRYIVIAEGARAAGAFNEAEEAFKRAQALDPANARARAGLEMLAQDRRHRALLDEAQALLAKNDTAGAHAKVREVLAQHSAHREAQSMLRRIEETSARAGSGEPQLSPALRKPVTLELREAPLRAVFELLAKHTGMNFVFDRDVKPDLRTTVFVRDTRVEDVIRFVLVTNQLDRKVLNENTLLIYPNTPQKNREYREMVMRSFYLANADAKATANMIKALVKTPDVFVDEKLNMLVIRDTAEAVRVAEKLVANQDLAEPEVMLEVEVLEVGTNLLTELGVKWPDSIRYGIVGAAGVPGQVTLPEWLNRNSGLVRLTLTDPLIAINLRKQDGRTNVLANPRIRVKNRDKARVHIGDKVPVITTTAAATGFVAESVNYLDVGLKLEVEPTVYLEDEVGIKVGLEVSNIAREIRSTSGTIAYQVGTRNAATTLRLRDGETQVLAGLINDEDRRSAAKIPGLGDLPVVGPLFGSTSVTANKTEIVLLITPRIVRNLARPDVRMEHFNAGTDAALGGAPLGLPTVSGGGGAVLSLPPGTPPAPPQAVPAPQPGLPPQPAPAPSLLLPSPGQGPAQAPAPNQGPGPT
jgi:general secretion pathway protein D